MTLLAIIAGLWLAFLLGALTVAAFASRQYDKGHDDGWRDGYLRGIEEMEANANSVIDTALNSVAKLKGVLFPVPPSDEVAEAAGEDES